MKRGVDTGTISRGGLILLSSSLSVGGDIDVYARPGFGGSPAPSALRLGGRTGDSSVWRRCLRDECSRYAGRGNAAAARVTAGAAAPGDDRRVLATLPLVVLALRVRAGEVEEEEGKQEAPAPRDVSTRMTLGSIVLQERVVARLGNDDKVNERAVAPTAGLPGKPLLPCEGPAPLPLLVRFPR